VLVLEMIALPYQIAVLKRSPNSPPLLRRFNQLLWIML
jgi:hypothetical protein